nr:unnamed protein product [Digitaria exilis]
MEFFTGALPSLLPKLAALATGEYNLQKGLKGEIKFLHAELESPMIRRKIATEIRGVKNHVIELHQLRMRYKIDSAPTSAIADVDPRLYAQSPETAELVGIDEARDELCQCSKER